MMKIALAQSDTVWENKEKNIEKAEKMIMQAKAERCDLILFPEMSFTGFSMNVEKIGEIIQEDGWCDSSRRGSDLAKKYGIAVGFGYVERMGKLGRNHYRIVGRDGEAKSDYVKLHPFSYGEEDRHYIAGDHIVQFQIRDVKMSIFICYDLRFPEPFQLASQNAEVLIVAANWPESRMAHWELLLRARAVENQCYVLGINRTGSGGTLLYTGGSMAIDPYGNVLERLGEREGILFCQIERKIAEDWRVQFPQKKDRKENYADFLKKGEEKL